jgi:hypothetical protein
MEVKLIELRDRGTFISCMAIRLTYRDAQERFLLRRAGFADEQIDPLSAVGAVLPYVILCSLEDGSLGAHYDPYSWRNQRTFGTAHRFLIDHWRHVQPGQVVDVEYILGETEAPKQSELITAGAAYRAAYGD